MHGGGGDSVKLNPFCDTDEQHDEWVEGWEDEEEAYNRYEDY